MGVAFLMLCFLTSAGNIPETLAPDGGKKTFRQCRELFENGIYDEARAGFENLAVAGDERAEGWALLCRTYQKSPGYERAIEDFAEIYAYSDLLPRIRFRYALNLFDEQRYKEALEPFAALDPTLFEREDRAELMFKQGYSYYKSGDDVEALYGFGRVLMMTHNTYTGPSQYMSGIIYYQRDNFKKALSYFESSATDYRFQDISEYYVLECKFMLKDYAFVTREGPDLHNSATGERKERLARMISEAYLIQGDNESAARYYETVRTKLSRSREDLFFAGSLSYARGDWQGAVDNFGSMTDRSDSLGQIANYQMGYSYIQLKNKVAALECFRDAAFGVVTPIEPARQSKPIREGDSVAEGRDSAQLRTAQDGGLPETFDKSIQEDAYYNYAKLSFDINKDGSVFKEYMQAYKDRAKNDQIYSYIALAALYDHDYAAAVEAYNEIDELDPDMRDNYKKANYLRANQLILSGAWRDAAPCLQAAAYYDSKYSTFNQLSRYWLAESYYRDGQYDKSRSLYNELYNLSALDGKPEGWLIPYNLAYCYFNAEDYVNSAKWFNNYLDGSVTIYRRDALLRIADCAFLQKDYGQAAASYNRVTKEYAGLDDLYPHYQGGVAYGRADNRAEKINILLPVRRARADAAYYSEALYELARTLADAGRTSEAGECYTLLVSNSGDKTFVGRGLLGLGLLERNAGNLDTSLSYYKRVVSEMPGTEQAEAALMAIEGIYQRKQEPEAYLAYLQSVKGDVSEADKEMILFSSAEQICLAGNYEKALSTLKLYEESYPQGTYLSDAWFYEAECFAATDRKDLACDYYRKVTSGSYREQAALNYARLTYDMGRYGSAYSGYEELSKIATFEGNAHEAAVGMMLSAYMAKEYVQAKYAAENVLSDKATTGEEMLKAKFIKGKSLLSMSLRDEAFEVLRDISSRTDTPEGAEAAYLLIQDSYDQGKFQEVEDKVYAFSGSGTSQRYWLAKAFILLGDSFAEREEYRQAKATFESIRDGYEAADAGDEILDSVNMRLRKITQLLSEE